MNGNNGGLLKRILYSLFTSSRQESTSEMPQIEKLVKVTHETFASSSLLSKRSRRHDYDSSDPCSKTEPRGPMRRRNSFGFGINIEQIIHELSCTSADDLKLHESMRALGPKANYYKGLRVPVTHINVFDHPLYTIGIFVLHPGAKIPLHDHPGMYGLIKVLHGEVSIRSFTPTQPVSSLGFQAKEESIIKLGQGSGPTVLTPDKNNIHEIEYVSGEAGRPYAAFLDILSPPYEPEDDGFNSGCSYYNRLEQDRTSVHSSGGRITGEMSSFVRLVPCPCPADYWNNTAPYKGPSLHKFWSM